MPIKCPVCGFENTDSESRGCQGGCGHTRFGTLVMVSEATGQHAAMSVETRVGRGLLRSFAGDDAKYASEEQFIVYMDAGLGSWAIRSLTTATNPTYVNRLPIRDPVPLVNETLISIGKDKMTLKVRIDG